MINSRKIVEELFYFQPPSGGSILSPEKNRPAHLEDFSDVLFSYFTRIHHLYQILDKEKSSLSRSSPDAPWLLKEQE
jgi:hypothetical protein